MKIYVKDATEESLKILADFCELKGWAYQTMRGFGRGKKYVDVQKVLNAYRDTKNIRASARAAGCSSGTAFRIIKSHFGDVRKGVENTTMENNQ